MFNVALEALKLRLTFTPPFTKTIALVVAVVVVVVICRCRRPRNGCAIAVRIIRISAGIGWVGLPLTLEII